VRSIRAAMRLKVTICAMQQIARLRIGSPFVT
jgi:hypothetical protein